MENVVTLAPTPIAAERYVLHSYSTSARIDLKAARERLQELNPERFSTECLILRVSDQKTVYLFSFGAVVFMNLDQEEQRHFLFQLQLTARPHQPKGNAIPEEDFAEDDFVLTIEPNTSQVGFNGVSLPEWDAAKVQMIAQLLGQSSALEIIEWEVEEFLGESERLARDLKRQSWNRRRRSQLMQLLGDGLSTRHRIVNQLALLNDPEKTWEKEDLYRLYLALWELFDIDERIEAIEKKLALSTEVSELLLDIANARRSEFLEWIIIALIAVEIVKSFLG
jgi:uncharacterized Rmd1/YagE family protein